MALGNIGKDITKSVVFSFVGDFVASLGADAAAAALFKDWGKNPGDKGLLQKVKDLFVEGKRDEAVATLMARPTGEGQADEAIFLNVLTNGLRRFQGGIYATQADELANWFATSKPKLREKFRLTWVLLDNNQRIDLLCQLAQMTPAQRKAHIKASGILDQSVRDKKLKKLLAQKQADNAVVRSEITANNNKSLWRRLADGDIFHLF